MEFLKFRKYFIFLIMISLVGASSPPSMSIFIYGKVVYDSGEPAEGVSVTATWMDSGENKHLFSTNTLTLAEAELLGNKNLAGQYRFLDGKIVSEIPKSVRIESMGEVVDVVGNPGFLTEAAEIVIEKEPTSDEETQEKVTEEIEEPLIEDNKTQEEIEKEKKQRIRQAYYEGDNFTPVIGKIPENIYVCENKRLSYYFNVSDPDGDSLTFGISSKKSSSLSDIFRISAKSSFGETTVPIRLFSDILNKSNLGIYETDIFAYDEEYIDIKTTNITVIEINNPPYFEDIGVMTVSLDKTDSLDYQVRVEDKEDGNQETRRFDFDLTFLDGKPFFGVNKRGVMKARLNESMIGVYDLILCVSDKGISEIHPNISVCGQTGESITVCKNFSLTVTAENKKPKIILKFPENKSLNYPAYKILQFSITKDDADLTIPETHWYIDDNFKEYDSGNLTDDFTYKFICAESGKHVIKAEITDGLLNDSIEWDVNIEECPESNLIQGAASKFIEKNSLVIRKVLIFFTSLVILIWVMIVGYQISKGFKLRKEMNGKNN